MGKKVTLRVIITLIVWIAGAYILNKYEYLIAFGSIDNITGMIPVALVLTGAAGATAILWIKHTKRRIPVSVVIGLLTVLSVALFPLALRGNWWINTKSSNLSEAVPDLSVYAPFSEGSLTVKLDESPALRLTDSLPVLDGATALYPVYTAFAEAVYDEDAYSENTVLCTNTKGAYEAVISGERDIIFVAGASEQQMTAAKDARANLKFTPIGREAFVFLVGSENPINNITYQQLRNIYSGKTAYWNTLGWQDGGSIIAFQRPEGSGSQTGLQRMVMRDLPVQVPQPLPDAGLLGTNSLMKQVAVEWNGLQPALGYSYRYFATTMYANPDVKLLAVNGVTPSVENIQSGDYPFVSDFYAVTNGEPDGNTKLLIDWILTPEGQKIIEKTGYTPLP